MAERKNKINLICSTDYLNMQKTAKSLILAFLPLRALSWSMITLLMKEVITVQGLRTCLRIKKKLVMNALQQWLGN